MKMRTFKRILLVILLLLTYVAVGAILPFAHTKRVDEMFKDTYRPEEFYGTSDSGPDRAAVVETSTDALIKRMQIISQAKERIVLSTFDIRDGSSSNDIFSAIWEAADRGVKVQILVDGVYGALHMSGNPLFYAISSSPNVEIRFYHIPSLLKPWSINGRMHDKYLVVDQQYLILGGRNTFDYFLGEYNPEKLSYDRDVFIYNTQPETTPSESAVHQVTKYFDTMWNSGYCQTVFDKPTRTMIKKMENSRDTLRTHYQDAVTRVPEFDGSNVDFSNLTIPIKKATLITNPIHTGPKEPYIWHQISDLMQNARESVYIHTPYAVLSNAMYKDMSKVKTPEFTMLVNSTAVGDNFMASSDYTMNRSKILDTGVTLYEFFGDLSSHGKSLLIDNDLSLIGSYNLDMRSTYVNTEVMLVIHGEEFNQQLRGNILNLQTDSLLVTPDGTYQPDPNVEYKELPPGKKLIYSITSRLFQLIRFLI